MAKATLKAVLVAVQGLSDEIAKVNTRVLALEKASMKGKVPAPAGKGKKTSTKSTKKVSSTKKVVKKGKGNTFDFSKIKGKTNSKKNQALHKELVKMGLKDSRTPEYMSVWNARPWVKA